MRGLPSLNYKLYCRNAQGVLVNYLVFTVTLYDSSDNVLKTATYRIGTNGGNIPG